MQITSDVEIDGGGFTVDAAGMSRVFTIDDGLGYVNAFAVSMDSITITGGAGTSYGSFDLNGDGSVNIDDPMDWLAAAGALNLPSGNPYSMTDANRDGVTDGLDFIAWNDHKFTTNSNFCDGDFNADGVVDGLDFIKWNSLKFTQQGMTQPETTQALPDTVHNAPLDSNVRSTKQGRHLAASAKTSNSGRLDRADLGNEAKPRSNPTVEAWPLPVAVSWEEAGSHQAIGDLYSAPDASQLRLSSVAETRLNHQLEAIAESTSRVANAVEDPAAVDAAFVAFA